MYSEGNDPNMGFDNYGEDSGYRPPVRNGMATASLTLGVMAIVSCLAFPFPLIFGTLSILCGLLSRTGRRLEKKCRMGIICGIIGAAASCIILYFTFSYILSTPQIRAYYAQYMAQLLDDAGLPQDYNIFLTPEDRADGEESDSPSEEEPGLEELLPFQDQEDPLDDIYRYFQEEPGQTPAEDIGGDFV